MDQEQLLSNFYNACYLYATYHGVRPIKKNFFVCDTPGSLLIADWRHESKTPTPSDLMTYTIEQCRDVATTREYLRQLDEGKKVDISEVEKNKLIQVKEGSWIYNTDLQVIQVYINNQWRTMTIN